MTIGISIEEKKYTRAILKTVNTFLNLSPTELDLVVVMLENNIYTLTKENREILRKKLQMDQANLNTYIHKLKKGNNIISKNNILSINPYIINVVKDKSITFNFETY